MFIPGSSITTVLTELYCNPICDKGISQSTHLTEFLCPITHRDTNFKCKVLVNIWKQKVMEIAQVSYPKKLKDAKAYRN